jgi:hypothetical protein
MDVFGYRVATRAKPLGYGWEIYTEGRPLAVAHSRNTFKTEGEALEAGRRALERRINREVGDVSQRAKSIVDRVTRDD